MIDDTFTNSYKFDCTVFFFFPQVSVKSNNGTDKDVIFTRGKYCNYFPVNVAEYRIVD